MFNGEEVARKYIASNPVRIKTDLETLRALNTDAEIQEWMTKHSARVVASLGTEVDRIELEIKVRLNELKGEG